MLSLVLVAMLGVIPTAEEAAAPAGSIEITQANVQFGNSVYLLVAVDYTDAYASLDEAKANITISIDGKVLSPDESVEAPEGTVGFKYTDLGAKNMGDTLEIKAYNGGVCEDTTVYSILEYTLKAKEDLADDEYLMAVVDAMIAFGAEAQAAFEYTGDYDLTKDHAMARAVGGAKFSNGYAKTILEDGAEAVTATHPDYADGAVWYNSSFEVMGKEATLSLSYSGKSETVYAVPASAATSNPLYMDDYDGAVYFYALEFTDSYTATPASGKPKFTNVATATVYVRESDGKLFSSGGIKTNIPTWFSAGSVIPSNDSKTNNDGAPLYGLDYTIKSQRFLDYLKENVPEDVYTDEQLEAMTSVEKWDLKDANGTQYYATFKTENQAMKKPTDYTKFPKHTYEEVSSEANSYGRFSNGSIYVHGTLNFKSTDESKASIQEACAAGNTFTLSVTLASAKGGVSPLSTFNLRNGSNTTTITANTVGNDGRVRFFSGANDKLQTYYRNDGYASAADAAVFTPGEYVTLHIVVDYSGSTACKMAHLDELSADGKYQRVCWNCSGTGVKSGSDCSICDASKTTAAGKTYAVCNFCRGDDKVVTLTYYRGQEKIGTMVAPCDEEFFNGSYLDIQMNKTSEMSFKNFVVTKGDITKYWE